MYIHVHDLLSWIVAEIGIWTTGTVGAIKALLERENPSGNGDKQVDDDYDPDACMQRNCIAANNYILLVQIADRLDQPAMPTIVAMSATHKSIQMHDAAEREALSIYLHENGPKPAVAIHYELSTECEIDHQTEYLLSNKY